MTPSDFVERSWPRSKIAVPDQLRSYGLTHDQLNLLMRAVMDLRQLAIDYQQYLLDENSTQAKVSKQVGLSTNRLSALRNGTSWPSWRAYAVMRAFVPTSEMPAGTDAVGKRQRKPQP
ncbi:hypothetical protein [Nocardioides sp.]|uniref:hypothetical protein n=1 Tax=Nocardioides sp. TaxID=35761 RepID=UPI0027334A72|nr:hypothetical protein [Nocardioides sp.]MDP3890489.1 hypothetical protein [Nocardioides sp.]